MNCNRNKIETSCLETQYATCVKYETDLPEWSEVDCSPTLEETTEELYEQVSNIKDDLDSSELNVSCLKLKGKKQKEINLDLAEAICEIKDSITKNGNVFSLCELDYGNLIDCDTTKPRTLCEFAQFILNVLNGKVEEREEEVDIPLVEDKEPEEDKDLEEVKEPEKGKDLELNEPEKDKELGEGEQASKG